MIVDDCAKLLDLLKQVENARENKHCVDNLNQRRDDLDDVRREVNATADMLDALKRREPLQGKPDGLKARSRASEMREALARDPASITKGRSFTNLKIYFACSFYQ